MDGRHRGKEENDIKKKGKQRVRSIYKHTHMKGHAAAVTVQG